MSLPARTANRAVVNILMMWVESSIGMTGVLTMSDKAVAIVISLRHGTSSIFAAETRDSARCAEVTAEANTCRLARSKEETTGAFGVRMMRAHAQKTSVVRETLKGLLMSASAALITPFESILQGSCLYLRRN